MYSDSNGYLCIPIGGKVQYVSNKSCCLVIILTYLAVYLIQQAVSAARLFSQIINSNMIQIFDVIEQIAICGKVKYFSRYRETQNRGGAKGYTLNHYIIYMRAIFSRLSTTWFFNQV